MKFRHLPSAAFAALLLCACGPDGVPIVRAGAAETGTTGVLRGARPSGSTTFVHRIDGDVRSIVRADLFPGGPQWVVLTGDGGGLDQGSVIVLDPEGAELMRYRVATDTPDGYRALAPNADQIAPYDFRGRKLLVVSTSGLRTPYSVEILEVTQRDGIRPLHAFWNPGAINTPVVADGLVAFRCLGNDLRTPDETDTYPVAVGVISVDSILASFERNDPEDASQVAYFVFDERAGPGHESTLSVTITNGTVRAILDTGLSYALDHVNGAVRAEADAVYAARHARRVAADASLPPLDQHLAQLSRSVRVVRPQPR